MRKRKEEKVFEQVHNFAEFVNFLCDDCKVKRPSRYDSKDIDCPFTEVDFRAFNIIVHLRFKTENELTALLRIYKNGVVFVRLASGQGENGMTELDYEGHPEKVDEYDNWNDIDTITII